MIPHADAVIVGSGAFGASVAFHLARAGSRVVVVDRSGLTSETSPRAAGLTMQIHDDDPMTRLAMRSVDQMTSFEGETGQPLPIHQVGSLKLGRTEVAAARVREEVARGRALGLEIDEINGPDARALAPYADFSRARAMWFTRTDLYLEPGDLPRAYLRAAESLGAELVSRTDVIAIDMRGGSVAAVVTSAGSIATPVVVDAAGAWAGVVAAMVGLFLPIVPVRHQLYITEPIAGVEPDMPIVRVNDAAVYVRPEHGGLLIGGYEPDPLPVSIEDFPPGRGVASMPLDPDPLRRMTESVLPEFPGLRDARVSVLRGGLPTMTPDGRPIFDQPASVPGFFVLAGCNVGGLSVSPAAGEAIASWIVSGVRPDVLETLTLSRFDSQRPKSEVRSEALLRYADSYLRTGSSPAVGA